MANKNLLTIKSPSNTLSLEVEIAGRFHSVHENSHGEQIVILIDRHTLKGDFYHSKDGWQKHAISTKQRYPKMVLEIDERLWVATCWISTLRLKGNKAGGTILRAMAE